MHDALDSYREAMRGSTVSRVSRGYGSALFLEFGALTRLVRKNGPPRGLQGEFGLMIAWSWRIEDRASIICGSWSDEDLWQPTFDKLLGRRITDIAIFGRLPEILVSLSDDLYVLSFMTAEGQPEWSLFDRRQGETRWLHCPNGQLSENRSSDYRVPQVDGRTSPLDD